jgi:hypothetical protein
MVTRECLCPRGALRAQGAGETRFPSRQASAAKNEDLQPIARPVAKPAIESTERVSVHKRRDQARGARVCVGLVGLVEAPGLEGRRVCG